MAYGVQVFDSSGNLTLDIGDQVAFFKATTNFFTIAGSTTQNYLAPGVTPSDRIQLITTNVSTIPVTLSISAADTVTAVNASSSSYTFSYAVLYDGE
jgi:hypothetical protein